MAIDPRFYRLARRVSAGELAGVLEAGLRGRAEAVIADFSQPQHSDETMLTYVGDAAQLDGAGPAGILCHCLYFRARAFVRTSMSLM